MHGTSNESVFFIVLTVLLFLALGIAMLVIIDHKAKIPGHLHSDSISGLRRDHPGIAFLTTTILLAIIGSLIFELLVALGGGLPWLEEKEEPKLLQMLKEQRVTEKNRHFHNEPIEDLPNLGNKPVCFYCHGDFPHSKERMVRTLLNMHTQFVGCMTCHNDPRKIDEKSLEFEWLNYSGIAVEGPPFGTDVQADTGYLIETDDYYSKIVAYRTEGGERELLEIPETKQEVQEFLAIKEQLSDKDRESVKKAFHKIVSPKGRFCSRCHTKEDKSYLPFRKLGFSEKRISAVTNLNIIGIVQKYRKFYMPALFQKDIPLPKVESLLGTENKSEEEAEDKIEDPRAWWRRTFDPSKAKAGSPNTKE